TSRSCDAPVPEQRRPAPALPRRVPCVARSFAYSLDIALPAILGGLPAKVGPGQVGVVLQDAVGFVDVGVIGAVEALGGLPLALPHLRVDQLVLDFHRPAAVHQADALDQLERIGDRYAKVDV